MSSFEKDSKIKLLTSKDFNHGKLIHPILKSGRTTVVFKTQWCIHCQNLKPHIAEISKMSCCISNTGAIDCDESKDLVTNLNKELKNKGFEVSGFPTIVQFIDGIYTRTYNGERTPEKLLQFFLGK